MATINPSTLESAESLKELQVDARQFFVQFSKAFKKCNKAEWEDKLEYLESAMHYLHFAEAAYQKIKYQFIEQLYAIAQKQQQNVENNPKESEEARKQIEEIMHFLIQLDKEQAVERVKADNMQRWIRGMYSKVNTTRKQVDHTVASHQQFERRKQMMEQRQQQREQEFHQRKQDAEQRKKEIIESHKAKREQRKMMGSAANDNNKAEGRKAA